jgi:hypothetical protein
MTKLLADHSVVDASPETMSSQGPELTNHPVAVIDAGETAVESAGVKIEKVQVSDTSEIGSQKEWNEFVDGKATTTTNHWPELDIKQNKSPVKIFAGRADSQH